MHESEVEPEELIKLIKKSPSKLPNDFRKQFHIAHIYEAMGSNKLAIDAWDKALKFALLEPENAGWIYRLQYENAIAKYHLIGIDEALDVLGNLDGVESEDKSLVRKYENRFNILRKQLLYLKDNPIVEEE